MNKQKKYLFIMLFISLAQQKLTIARSIHRPSDKTLPQLKTNWLGKSSPNYTLQSSHLEAYPLFRTFNKKHFKKNLLPNKLLSYRYEPQKSVHTSILKKKVAQLLKEIKQKRKKFTDFIILSHRDFNFRKTFGLMILKFKDYPFVVKISIETPKSFVRFSSKGFVSRFIYHMAGGINKHLLGFTRIRNLEIMQELIKKDTFWAKKVSFPRKWHLLPKNNNWIKLTGINFGEKKKHKIVIPSVYCIVSDWIDAQRQTSMLKNADRRLCMNLCNYLELAIDPHIPNFIIERSTGKIAIIDTEHFLTVVGIKKKREFTGYISWVSHLAGKCIGSMFFKTKDGRKIARLEKSEAELLYPKT